MKNKKRNLLAFLIFFLANTLFLPLCSVFAEENADGLHVKCTIVDGIRGFDEDADQLWREEIT